jgi:hypothetical protein
MKIFRKIRTDESGSAVLEFIALALPLFIPLFIYLGQYEKLSDTQMTLKTLSREMARAFVTSENDEVAERVTYEVFVKGANVLGFGDEIASGSLNYHFECSAKPCISPNSKIVISILSSNSNSEIRAVEYVSPWA